MLALLATAGCGGVATRTATTTSSPAPVAGGPRAGATAPAVNPADLKFITGMIHHHSQAVLIAGWAASHGARPDVLVLCERIVNAQQDEINLMKYWLREHGQTVPIGVYPYPPSATGAGMAMGGMNMGAGEHAMMMPGILTDEQLVALDKARGPDFDRLFMQDMIKHHEGALTMVDELLHSPGAAQDDMIYKMSSDIYADQTTEIERMQRMLANGPVPTRSP